MLGRNGIQPENAAVGPDPFQNVADPTKVHLLPSEAVDYYTQASKLSPDYARKFPKDYRPNFEEQKIRLAMAIAVCAGEPNANAHDMARHVSMPTIGYNIERGTMLDALRKRADVRIAAANHASVRNEGDSPAQAEPSRPTASAHFTSSAASSAAAAGAIGVPKLDLSSVTPNSHGAPSQPATTGSPAPDSPTTAAARDLQKLHIATVPGSDAAKTSVDAQREPTTPREASGLRPQTQTFLGSFARRDDLDDLTPRSQQVVEALENPSAENPKALKTFLVEHVDKLRDRDRLGNLQGPAKAIAMELKNPTSRTTPNHPTPRTPPSSPRGVSKS
jgi:hypothetical protein